MEWKSSPSSPALNCTVLRKSIMQQEEHGTREAGGRDSGSKGIPSRLGSGRSTSCPLDAEQHRNGRVLALRSLYLWLFLLVKYRVIFFYSLFWNHKHISWVSKVFTIPTRCADWFIYFSIVFSCLSNQQEFMAWEARIKSRCHLSPSEADYIFNSWQFKVIVNSNGIIKAIHR